MHNCTCALERLRGTHGHLRSAKSMLRGAHVLFLCSNSDSTPQNKCAQICKNLLMCHRLFAPIQQYNKYWYFKQKVLVFKIEGKVKLAHLGVWIRVFTLLELSSEREANMIAVLTSRLLVEYH